MAIGDIILSSALPVIQVVLMCTAGALAVRKGATLRKLARALPNAPSRFPTACNGASMLQACVLGGSRLSSPCIWLQSERDSCALSASLQASLVILRDDACGAGVISAEAMASLSRLIFYVFLPSLIFVSLGERVTAAKLGEWWFLLVNILINVALGWALGLLLSRVCGVPERLRAPYIACASIGALRAAGCM